MQIEMKKIKVAQVRWCEPTGGVERVLRDIGRYIDSSRFHLGFFFIARGGPFKDELQRLGHHVELIPAHNGYDLRMRIELARRLRQFRPAIVQEHGVPVLVRPFIRWSTKAPLLGFEHGEIAINRRKGKPWLNLVNGLEYQLFSECVVVNSAANGMLVRETHHLPPERVKVVHIGIDLDEFRQYPLVPPPSSDISNKLVLGYVGRIQNYDKGTDLLPQIVGLMVDDGLENLEIRVIGDGPDLADLKADIARLHLTKYFQFMGLRKDVANLLAEIDILVMPSRMEAFGLVAIEALAAGVRVVASDLPGIREVVANAPDTCLVSPDIASGFAEAIVKLWEIHGKQRSQQGRVYVSTYFDIRRTVTELQEIYIASVQ